MSNVIRLTPVMRHHNKAAKLSALIESFACHRRMGEDVFWLKENAELLNILECTGAVLEAGALAPHQVFYDQIAKRLEFFPQYYRFLLSICLDLEDLGMQGNRGEALARWVAREGLPGAELSDLQRAEARRLLMRRGVDPMPGDSGLPDRLHQFINRSETFALPNKKAAYELTHIVFYLSEYGRRDPGVSQAGRTSLEYAGILAYLDQNADLLAEICVALRYTGATPSPIWEDWLARETRGFVIQAGTQALQADAYHDYFVCNWAMSACGREAFGANAVPGQIAFHRAAPVAAPLRDMSQLMFRLEERRSDDWQVMRPLVDDALNAAGHDILAAAEASSDKFDAFFAGFARTGLRGAAL